MVKPPGSRDVRDRGCGRVGPEKGSVNMVEVADLQVSDRTDTQVFMKGLFERLFAQAHSLAQFLQLNCSFKIRRLKAFHPAKEPPEKEYLASGDFRRPALK